MGALFSILVDIAAKTASFESGMDRIDHRLESFGENVKRVMEVVAEGAVAEFVKNTIELGDSLGSAATKAGVAAEAFTEIAYAAKLNSVSTDNLSAAFVKMNVALSKAATGGKEQNEALSALGLTYKDLKSLAPEEQFEIIANQITKLTSESDKSRAEIALFGRAGADLAPLLEKGAAGIVHMREEAVKLGQSFSSEQLKIFEEAHQSIDRLEQSFSSLASTLVGKVAPSLAKTLDSITALVTQDPAAITTQHIDFLKRQALDDDSYIGFQRGGDLGLGLHSPRFALHRANTLQARLDTQNLALSPEMLKLMGTGLLNLPSPGFFGDDLPGVHPNLMKESFGNAGVNPAVQQYLDSTRALSDAGGQAEEEFRKTSRELQGALDDNAISIDDFNTRMENARLKFNDAIDIQPLIVNLKKLPEILTEADHRSLDFVSDVQSAFENAAQATGAFGQNLLKSLLQAFENRAIFNAIGAIGQALKDALNVGGRTGGSWWGNILGGLIGNGFSGVDVGALADSANFQASNFIDQYNASSFGGGRASGGPLEMGKWYIAGERGPEPVWGGGPGAYATGYGSGGGAPPQVNIINNIDARGASIDLIKALPSILKKNNDGLEAKIITGLQRNKYTLG